MNFLKTLFQSPDFKSLRTYQVLVWSLLYAYIAGYILQNFAGDSVASLIWVPAGIGLALLLNFGISYWPYLFVAAVAGEMLGGFSIFISFLLAIGSTLSCILSAYLLSKVFPFNRNLSTLVDVASLVLVSTILGLCSGLIDATIIYRSGLAGTEQFQAVFYTWFIGDFFGAAFFTPVLLVWRRFPKDWLKTPKLYEVLTFFGLVFLFGQGVLFGWLNTQFDEASFVNQGYLILPILLIAALRYGRHGAMLVLAMTVVQSLLGAYDGHGFFNHSMMNDPAPISIWIFLSLIGLVSLLISLLIENNQAKNIDLVKAEGRFKEIVERIPVSMAILDIDKRAMNLVNDAYTNLTGYTASDFGVSDDWWNLAYPNAAYRQEIEQLWDERVHEARHDHTPMVPVESWIVCKNGEKKYISWGSVSAGDKFAIYGIDLTERKKNEDLLKITSSVYQAIGEAVFITNPKNEFILVNDVFTGITGYGKNQIVGLSLHSLLVKAEGASEYADLLPALDSVGHWEGQVWIKCSDGTNYLGFLSLFSALDDKGNVRQRVGLISQVSDQKKYREIITRQANYDALTGLPNRRLFLDRVDEAIKRADRSKNNFALLFVDLDRFKDINDTSGHDVGDELLRIVSERFKAEIRETDTVARIGGDEFTIILNDLEHPKNLDKVLLGITDRLAEPIEIENKVFHISASLGIAFYPQDATSTKGLLMKADQAMYAVKSQGRNGYHYFTQSLQEVADQKMRVISELRTALQNNQFYLHYQPIVDLASGKILHAEALLRWRKENGQLSLPVNFIEVAEDSGLIIEIGDWVFKQVCQFLQDLAVINKDISIGINVSASQFNSNKHSALDWIDYLQERGLSSSQIILEVTEHTMMNQNARVAQKIALLHKAGFKFAIDDFGTGYSSLSALRNFNFNYLKIDFSFTRQITHSKSDEALVRAMVTMGAGLSLHTIAEGVETEEQRQALLNVGCTLGQGYLFSRPVPEEDFIKLLESSSI
ncbi:GGDEF domain-containing phosphodiesterase [Polynucleobacter sp. UB-Tiil-W10]|uniref:GGDEF domain-containing phosphodiesterase n=1 Tax=Polynucleobacter sp. UB-Tiil-W10 TaxID=1855648 RepID=UPI001C0D8E8F|nr:GGDEF domain-containing phosphodiesterase [Polynucleobacter sp. UB-Tiil-W10]MBU3539648.1 EAL domain-containing protein [Polynucleobacter sp. UB-Tiil-W10]